MQVFAFLRWFSDNHLQLANCLFGGSSSNVLQACAVTRWRQTSCASTTSSAKGVWMPQTKRRKPRNECDESQLFPVVEMKLRCMCVVYVC